MMCKPPGASLTVFPAGNSKRGTARMRMIPPSIDIECSSARAASGLPAAMSAAWVSLVNST
jgi:hypothetical protein